MVEAQRLIDRYRLEQRLASGGMGTVYEATDERLQRRVAVKLLKEELADDPLFVERFRREARAVAALSHPNIASVFDYGADGGRDFIVMELLEGTDLAEVLRAGPLEPSRAAGIAAQACDALAHAHAAGIVHRDIKPANIILVASGRVKVTDFGIARALGDTTLTATGSVLGTAHYLAPEQASGSGAGAAVDQYAMGVMLYEMLTGEVPFSGDSPIGVAMRHVSDEIPAPSSKASEVPAELDKVVLTATAKDPSDRYPDIAAMASALRATVASPAGALGTPTTPLTAANATQELPQSSWNPARAGRMAGIALGVLAALLLGLVAARLLSAPSAVPERDRKQGGAADKPSPSPSPSPVPETFTLPSVVGLDYASAAEELESLGLKPARFEDPEAEGDLEEVVDTDPDPGREVTPGDTIEVYVAVAPPAEENQGQDHPGKPGEGKPGKGKGHGQGKKEEDD
jgi:eukaryotic-like serine/threonine-protein kinase